ncbi:MULTISPECIES: MutS-related protein [Butyricimonas]|uniref:MutS-related protein n=1 Tax=Butyricimonas TaxID=574697 RepID=UPI0007FB4E15|nr:MULTISPECIES: hypothetical protein [Butyricimonas]
MAFITDQQTLNDLGIFGRVGRSSVYDLFKAKTRGGAAVLREMFNYPLESAREINRRGAVIRYLQEREIEFPFMAEWFNAFEYYLSNRDQRTRLTVEGNTLGHRMRELSGREREYSLLQKGVLAGIRIVKGAELLLQSMAKVGVPEEYRERYEQITEMLRDSNLSWALSLKNPKKLPYARMADYDFRFRFEGNERCKRLLSCLYELDVYIAVAGVARKRGLVFGRALEPEANVFHAEGMYHPLLSGAVANTLHADGNSNVIFLTGANMAGKSTLMKAFSITLFLAHMGFPLPVSRMEFSVRNGMYTTINLPDDLDMGYSHFYAEVLRVRRVAERVRQVGNMAVVFDELFRGTNVKDAYDATLAVTEAFATRKDCLFLISTHIIEVGEVLRERCDNVHFTYLPTVKEGGKLIYPYTLESGISDDRYGMAIINREGIVEMLGSQREKVETQGDFEVDTQTLADLHILGKFKERSVFNLFNHTCTRGGEQLLDRMFQHPLTDADAINERSGMFEFFKEREVAFPFTRELVDRVERYLGIRVPATRGMAYWKVYSLRFFRRVSKEKKYDVICAGVMEALELLRECAVFNASLGNAGEDSVYGRVMREMRDILENKLQIPLFVEREKREFSVFEMARYDYLLRHVCRDELWRLLEMIYETDVYIAVAAVAKKMGFVRAMAIARGNGENRIDLRGFSHPLMPGAVGNSIRIDREHNVLFLTGANMAGKSTLMKAFGIALYLAHMGFPVAAAAMEFTVHDGLYTSINMSDHLNMGYSHFYAEVARVKRVAEEVCSGKHLAVVFDELFKGTNVKDAYDATVAVMSAFGGSRNCSYMVSTHITEAGSALAEKSEHFRFMYLPTVMKGKVPTYTYRLTEGISSDRHGMMMVANERIVEIITGK